MSEIEDEVLENYHQINREIDYLCTQLRNKLGRPPCPVNCYSCCLNTSTLLISEVEGLDIKKGLEELPSPIKKDIYEKSLKTIIRVESLGFTEEQLSEGNSTKVAKKIRGTEESRCMMLVGGACVIYNYRPVICRVWGYPMENSGDGLSCCYKTFVEKRRSVEPLNYSRYWKICRYLSSKLGVDKKTPFCYMVKRFLEEIL